MADAREKPATYRFEIFQLDLETGQLHRKGAKVKLQGKPVQVLALLLERPGKIVTRDELRQHLWPAGTYVEFEDSLNAAVKKLRRALGDSANKPRFVETIPRRGYRFIAPVTGTPELGPHTRPPSIRSVVVLPLENLSGEPSQEYFAAGITEELTTCLARMPDLHVISRTSATRYKAMRKTARQIGRELAVDAFVEGSVERRGDRMHVRVRLVHAETDQHLWAQTYDRELSDFSVLEDEFARGLAAHFAVQMEPTSVPVAAPRRVNPAALENYLKGRYFLMNRRDKVGIEKAEEYFQRAIKKDPDYASPHSGLAASYACLRVVAPEKSAEWLVRAEVAANQAVKLDPTLAEAHAVLAVIAECNYDFQACEREYQLAIRLNPNSVMGRQWYASLYLAPLGRFEEANREIAQARALDPLSGAVAASYGGMLYFQRRYEEASRALSEMIHMDPMFAEAYMWRALVLLEQRRYQEAIADLERSKQFDNTPRRLAFLGFGLGVAGKYTQAREVLSRLTTLSQETYVSPWLFALVHLGLGETDETFAWLTRAYQERSIELVFLSVIPVYDPLREDPRFAQLLARIGLPHRNRALGI